MIERKELYYWEDSKGQFIPKDELSDLYVCNIVMKFGKNWLNSNGHSVIVQRFEDLNSEYRFFEAAKHKGE